MKDIFQSAALVTLLAWGNAAPALAQENLPGAQLEGLLAIAKANNPDYASMRQEAQAASEAFLTSATQTVMPVVRIDGRAIGSGEPGPITKRLRTEFHKAAEIGPKLL